MRTKLPFLLLMVTGLSFGQVISFADSNLQTKLLQSSPANSVANNGIQNIAIDANADGNITVAEASVVKTLNISTSNIASLVGLELFTNLENMSILSVRHCRCFMQRMDRMRILCGRTRRSLRMHASMSRNTILLCQI